MVDRILFIGYGNPDREDDGAAWYVLREIAVRLGLPVPTLYEDEFPANDQVSLAFHLQLAPEMAEEIASYNHVCFIDAHTGFIPELVRLVHVDGEFQRSPFTHHLTPQSLISFCETIYNKKPNAVLLSVRGYDFRFSRELSKKTAILVSQAVDLIWNWLIGEGILAQDNRSIVLQ